ncbi:MAG: hypothetical protein AB7L66_09835 [Gemmatimonadales bacterium]
MSDVVLAATDRPLPVLVRRIEDERVPEGMVGIGTHLGDRLIARCAVSPEAAEVILAGDLFKEPVQLVLAGKEDPPGLQCRLYALVEVEQPEEEDGEPDEPWAASVPRFEAEAEAETDAESGDGTQGMVFLGQIVRFDRDRKHPDSLALETADVLRTLVEGKAGELVDRVLDDLLGEFDQ